MMSTFVAILFFGAFVALQYMDAQGWSWKGAEEKFDYSVKGSELECAVKCFALLMLGPQIMGAEMVTRALRMRVVLFICCRMLHASTMVGLKLRSCRDTVHRVYSVPAHPAQNVTVQEV
jgi:hypothetical protein